MPEKILVVDDEPTILETVAYNLKNAGYDVIIAADGPAALEACSQTVARPRYPRHHASWHGRPSKSVVSCARK